MINIKNLKRQHENIIADIDFIASELRKGSLLNQLETALYINRLAGKIKIHLMEEDKYMYPELLHLDDTELRIMAEEYIDEMGDLANQYVKFKNEYNTGSKIAKNKEAFLDASKEMMKILKTRIDKEDNELYRIIEERRI